jgi:type IV pilus assembly protein PilW
MRKLVANRKASQGLTLVELMVAMALMLVVILAAVISVTASSRSFGALDQAAQLKETVRFASDTLTRVILQAGYENTTGSGITKKAASLQNSSFSPEPDIRGFNNTLATSEGNILANLSHSSRDANCGSVATTACINGSDAIVVRFDGSSVGLTNTADGTMVNCFGRSEPSAGESIADRPVNIFHIRADSNGEPSLYCSYRSATGTMQWEVLASGIETLQFLYGVDNVTPAVATLPTVTFTATPTRYLRADQIDVPGNEAASRDNWNRVRSIKVGMVVRGPVGSAQNAAASAANFYPLGSTIFSSDDPGTQLASAADGRLRQVVSFTIHVRNDIASR